jgi:hypothetical protein
VKGNTRFQHSEEIGSGDAVAKNFHIIPATRLYLKHQNMTPFQYLILYPNSVAWASQETYPVLL